MSISSGGATDRLRAALSHAILSGEPGQSDWVFPAEYRGICLERWRDCGFQLYSAVGVEHGDKAAYARTQRLNALV